MRYGNGFFLLGRFIHKILYVFLKDQELADNNACTVPSVVKR